jgi:superfamily II DNA or RNA helicase
MDHAYRAGLIDDLGNGRLDVLTSCDIISEGVDVPVVSAAILLRPTQSLALCLQQMGRALRPYPGKTHTTILDHAGNVYRHGLPDEPREWTLEGRDKSKRKSEDAFPVRQCSECYAVHRPAPKCPSCGFEYPVKSREIDHVSGELERVTLPVHSPTQSPPLRREQSRARSFDDLVALGRQRGYKNPTAWASHVWRARTG